MVKIKPKTYLLHTYVSETELEAVFTKLLPICVLISSLKKPLEIFSCCNKSLKFTMTDGIGCTFSMPNASFFNDDNAKQFNAA